MGSDGFLGSLGIMGLKVVQWPVGPFQMNTTLVIDEATSNAIFFDPGDSVQNTIDYSKQNGINIIHLIATHCHIDHILFASEAISALGLDLQIHPSGKDFLAALDIQAAMFGLPQPAPFSTDFFLNEGDKVLLGDATFEILHCPGHSPDSLCFYDGEILIGGDVLFHRSVGRTDIPGGDSVQLIDSITKKLLSLPDSTIVYPGHGPTTTIGDEKLHNPFLNGRLRLV